MHFKTKHPVLGGRAGIVAPRGLAAPPTGPSILRGEEYVGAAGVLKVWVQAWPSYSLVTWP